MPGESRRQPGVVGVTPRRLTARSPHAISGTSVKRRSTASNTATSASSPSRRANIPTVGPLPSCPIARAKDRCPTVKPTPPRNSRHERQPNLLFPSRYRLRHFSPPQNPDRRLMSAFQTARAGSTAPIRTMLPNPATRKLPAAPRTCRPPAKSSQPFIRPVCAPRTVNVTPP